MPPTNGGEGSGSPLIARLGKALRASRAYAPLRRRRLLSTLNHPDAFPDWATLIRSDEASWIEARSTPKKKRVLLATSLGLQSSTQTIDSLLAVALTFRGAEVDVLLCDKALPACQIPDHVNTPSVSRMASHGPVVDFCGPCWKIGQSVYEPLGLNVLQLSEWAVENPDEHKSDEEHAIAATLRFFGRDRLRDDEMESLILARYRRAARRTRAAMERLFAHRRYDAVVAHHGIYVPQGSICDVAKRFNTPLVTWHSAYRSGCFVFQHGDTYHRAMVREPVARWNRPLSVVQRKRLMRYLDARANGSNDWVSFQQSPRLDPATLYSRLRLERNKPCALLLANVAWDARLHYPDSAFGTMVEWIEATVRFFAARPDLQLIVRSHPGEILGSPVAQDRVADIARGALADSMPDNIVILEPDAEINTYSLTELAKVALIYNTKMGLELAARGMPVIVAGDAWIRAKGISRDVGNPDEYLARLKEISDIAPLSGEAQERAVRYAYHFFFRRYIRLSSVVDLQQKWPLFRLTDTVVKKIRDRLDPGLERVVAGILSGTPFEYDELE